MKSEIGENMNEVLKTRLDVTIVPQNNIEYEYVEKFIKKLNAVIDVGYRTIYLDFNKVNAIDVSGISVLVEASHKLLNNGSQLKIINISSNLVKLLKETSLDKSFDTSILETDMNNFR